MIDFGWRVEDRDGHEGGTVAGVVFQRDSYTLWGLVVRRGALATRDIVVPAEHVASIGDGTLVLSITGEEIEQFEDFRQRRFISPESEPEAPPEVNPAGVVVGTTPAVFTGEPTNPYTVGGLPLVVEIIGNVPEECVVFWDGQIVLTEDSEPVGNVTHLIYQEGQLSGLVVDSEGLFGSGRVVPLDLIVEHSVEELGLAGAQEDFERLREAPVA